MASGIGHKGTNRCFPFWEDFQQCYFSSKEKTRADCMPARDDYLECLHHFKEIARVRAIQTVERNNYAKSKANGTDHKIISLSPSTSDSQSDNSVVHKLEASVLSSHENLNNIVEIYKIASGDDAEAAFTAANSLGRIYSALWTKGLLKRAKSQQQNKDSTTAAAAKVSEWIRENYKQYVDLLKSMLGNSNGPIQIAALRLLLQMIDKEGQSMCKSAGNYVFPNDSFLEAIEIILNSSDSSEHLLRTLAESYLNAYDDLRLYFYRDLVKLASPDYDPFKNRSKRGPRASSVQHSEVFVQNAFAVMNQIRTMPKTSNENMSLWVALPKNSSDAEPSVLSPAAHTRAFSEAWLALMRLQLNPEIYKQILLMMHKRIIPHMSDPKLLMDFLSNSYETGGSVSLLALNGLFTLITEHNLNYPQFYEKLYALFDRNLFHVKYRARFFRLLEVFLGSSHLPAYLIAAFIKRMARLALFAPPAGIVTAIPMIYNLLKSHPSCMVLIHRMPEYDSETGEEKVDKDCDPFIADEPDLSKCQALQSSLWELETLQHHYYPNIATLAKIFNEPFHKPQFMLEDFLDHTYTTFFESDTSRKPKKAPALATQPPTTLIRPGDALSDFMSL
ncbi:Maturation and nuclear export of 40S ribosomal subunits interacting protein [Coemansia sp. RSA 990]|nr:Maturation and nuclear export of 40S ribosomal subunits interacting protein [Coemansia sp. RSA 990]